MDARNGAFVRRRNCLCALENRSALDSGSAGSQYGGIDYYQDHISRVEPNYYWDNDPSGILVVCIVDDMETHRAKCPKRAVRIPY